MAAVTWATFFIGIHQTMTATGCSVGVGPNSRHFIGWRTGIPQSFTKSKPRDDNTTTTRELQQKRWHCCLWVVLRLERRHNKNNERIYRIARQQPLTRCAQKVLISHSASQQHLPIMSFSEVNIRIFCPSGGLMPEAKLKALMPYPRGKTS